MSEDNLLGAQLDEYRLEVMLGRGGMARVYRALDTNLNRYVAFKVIDTPYRGDEEYVKRFKIEAQAIARLDHPHVVHLYRYGEVNGMLYMAMQFIEGADLGFVLESYRQDREYVPASDALRLVTEICQALDYIHAHGIIHRDVKPSNIMLTHDEGRVILTDFGLALRAEVGTRGKVFGSPHYIAPEQAVSSARAVPQSDLYSVGVILYEMVTGVLPFNAPDPMDVAVMHMSSPPPHPRTVRPDMSPEVEAIILKALEKKPEDRFQTGRALYLALEHALRSQLAEVPPTRRTVPERVTIGFAANPLAALPPVPPAAVPAKPLPAEAARPANLPPPTGELPPTVPPPPGAGQSYAAQEASIPPAITPKPAGKKTSPWLLVGAAGLVALCILACLGVGGLSILLRGGLPFALVATQTPETPTVTPFTPSPTAPDTPTPTPPGDYHLKFWHCQDETCLVVENSGKVTFPLAGLVLKGKDSSLSGSDWGTPSLQPGQCVIAVNDTNWIGTMPDGATCEITGTPLVRKGKDRFWNNGFSIYYQDRKVADCQNKGSWCEILVKRQ